MPVASPSLISPQAVFQGNTRVGLGGVLSVLCSPELPEEQPTSRGCLGHPGECPPGAAVLGLSFQVSPTHPSHASPWVIHSHCPLKLALLMALCDSHGKNTCDLLTPTGALNVESVVNAEPPRHLGKLAPSRFSVEDTGLTMDLEHVFPVNLGVNKDKWSFCKTHQSFPSTLCPTSVSVCVRWSLSQPWD